VRLGHESRAAFLTIDDEPDALAVGMKAVEYRQEALSRNTEGQFDALLCQALDNQVTRRL